METALSLSARPTHWVLQLQRGTLIVDTGTQKGIDLRVMMAAWVNVRLFAGCQKAQNMSIDPVFIFKIWFRDLKLVPPRFFAKSTGLPDELCQVSVFLC